MTSHTTSVDTGGSDDSVKESEFQTKLARLIELCDKPTSEELQERDSLLAYFRKKGYSNEEISDMIGGKLKPDTIRKRNEGVQVEDSSLKERIAKLIGDMVRSDLSFNAVRKAISIQKALDANGVAPEDISLLLGEASKEGYDAKDVVAIYKDHKAAGLSFKKLVLALDYKAEFESIGLKVDNLEQISKIANKNGRDAGKVLGAVSAFDNLEAIQTEIETTQKNLDQLNERYGIAETDTEKAELENAHLREAIALSKDMMQKYGFTRAALKDTYELAKKCGNPFEVMNILAQYQDLTQEIKNLSDHKTSLASEVTGLEDSVNNLKGDQEAIRNSIKGLLDPVSKEISKAFSDATNNITNTYKEQLQVLKGASQEYAERLGKSLALKEELEYAKVINLIIKYPLEAKKLRLDYAIIMLDAVKKLLFAKRVEAKIKAGPAGITNNSLCEGMEVDAIDLVEGAIRALETNARVPSDEQ